MFAPDANLGKLKPFPPRSGAFRGEMERFVMNALREARGPITSLEITRAVMKGRGLADKVVSNQTGEGPAFTPY